MRQAAAHKKEMRMKKLKGPATPTPKARKTRMTFEKAMKHLRAGESIRRVAWHPESRIFKLGNDVFVLLPKFLAKAPAVWQPYSHDVLSPDWVLA
jgi:hypothetical protein